MVAISMLHIFWTDFRPPPPMSSHVTFGDIILHTHTTYYLNNSYQSHGGIYESPLIIADFAKLQLKFLSQF